MKITEIVYKRLHNLGNYENQQVELKAIINDDDIVQDVFKKLKKEADLALGLFTCDLAEENNEDEDFTPW